MSKISRGIYGNLSLIKALMLLVFFQSCIVISHFENRNKVTYRTSKDGVRYPIDLYDGYVVSRFTSDQLEKVRGDRDSARIYIEPFVIGDKEYGAYGVSYHGLMSHMTHYIFFLDSMGVFFANDLSESDWKEYKSRNTSWISDQLEEELDYYYKLKVRIPPTF